MTHQSNNVSKSDVVLLEIPCRRDIVIVDIAKKYGGGGHACACGTTVESFDVVEKILEDFDRLLEE